MRETEQMAGGGGPDSPGEAMEAERQAGRARRFPLADKASLSSIRRAIRSDMTRAGIDSSSSFDCLVAVTEACSNALIHGPGNPIAQISWEISDDRVRFLVQDYSLRDGARSDHPSRSLELEPSLEDRRIGGFGMELMRNLMDEVEIKMGPTGTMVSLVKALDAP